MLRPLEREDIGRRLTGLILEQVHRVTGVVPEQVIGPAARLALEIDVFAAKEIGLHDELLQFELARNDFVVHPLVRWIEPPRMAGHGDQTGLLLHGIDLLRIGQRVGDRNLDLDVLAGPHDLDGLGGMHLCRRGCASASSRSEVQCGIPYFLATASTESGRPPARLTTSTPSIFLSPSRCFWPNAPWPTITIFIAASAEKLSRTLTLPPACQARRFA